MAIRMVRSRIWPVAVLLALSACQANSDAEEARQISRDDVVKALAASGLAVCYVTDSEPGAPTDAIVTLRGTADECGGSTSPGDSTSPAEIQVGLVHVPEKPRRDLQARAATFRECQLVATMGEWLVQAGNACVGTSMRTSAKFIEQAIAALRADDRVKVWPPRSD